MYYRLGVGFCSGKLGAVSPLEKFPRALCCRFLYGGKFFEIRSQNDLPKKTTQFEIQIQVRCLGNVQHDVTGIEEVQDENEGPDTRNHKGPSIVIGTPSELSKALHNEV